MEHDQQPPAADDKLDRILHSVEKDRRRRWVEILIAIMLSVATTASAWCAYQSTLWGGVKTFRLVAVGTADRQAMTHAIEAFQQHAFDSSMFMEYLAARAHGDRAVEELLYAQFRPEVRPAHGG